MVQVDRPQRSAGEPDRVVGGYEHSHGGPEHGRGHDPEQGGDHHERGGLHHRHAHATGLRGFLQAVWQPHSHDGAARVDPALESSARGIRALKLSLLGLGATALFQLVVVLASGSVALLADTVHNVADALTALPLWIAFAVGRRAASRRYTYGFGRTEDLAGVFIVAMIALSAALAAGESLRRLLDPQPIEHLGWVALAAIVGFLGNEGVAIFRIRVGREIGSAALVADGYHARADGLTSLAVLVGAVGFWLGFPLADPLVGFGISVAILFVLKDAVRHVWHRLMDAVEPELVDRLERAAAAVPGVQAVHHVRLRWLGHRLEAELHATVDEDLPTRASHRLGEAVRHALFHTEPRLAAVQVHVDPCGHGGEDPHALTAHHTTPAAAGRST